MECTDSAACTTLCEPGQACAVTCGEAAECRCQGEGCALECAGGEPVACEGEFAGFFACDPEHCDGIVGE